MEPTTEELIQHAIKEAKAGNKETAKKILSGVVIQTPQDARVWYLLSQVVEKPEQALYCLGKVLNIQPDNEQAKQRILSIKATIDKPNIPVYEKPLAEKPLLSQQSEYLHSRVKFTKKCPYCAETIRSDAIVCRFCGRRLIPPFQCPVHLSKTT